MKISTLLKFTSFLSILMVALLGFTLFFSTQYLKQELSKNEVAIEFIKAITTTRYLTLEYALRHEERSMVQWRLQQAKLKKLLSTTLFQDTEEQGIIVSFTRSHERIELLFSQISASYSEHKSGSGDDHLFDELEARLIGQISNNIHKMISDALLLSERSRNGVRNAQRQAVVVASIAGIFLLLVIAVTSYLMITRITRPLYRLQDGIGVVGSGNLGFRFAMVEKDEVGELARAFDAMTEKLEKTTFSRDEIAKINQVLEVELARRQKAEADLAHSNQALIQSNLDLQRFANVASHDLQTPLRGIAGFVHLLRTEYAGRFDAQADDWMERTIRSTEVLQTLIKDLLEYSRIDANARPFELVSMQDVYDDALLLLDASIRESNARVTRTDLPTISCDRSLMVQLIHNLVGNALKYCTEKPNIHVSAEARGADWLFSIRDNGIGIEAKHFDRIFEIFKRLHNNQKYPGTGIGLAICQRVVHHHGGKIWVESVPEQGSTFYFTIPMQKAAES